ncbi:NAD(P)-dependent oxidoreductase [Bordetella sp. BOR01]|uniref:NAD-dependent epimerase/dehydratase family protein n=1 Tax=Bordetella sp. BOR01 TaxID=2854779 RepID=UPI001C43FBEB|nr:NAD-dependent epimerase/dehydratase family protein [Bordetella sp. BOR01]MBV7484598.1 NAD-dependent epimerase/dehydratase family protein [Bordetella sp. BOR01]
MLEIENGSFLITGGLSLIGSHLVDALQEKGAKEIRLLDNFSLGSSELAQVMEAKPGVKVIRGDITRLPDLLHAMKDVDGVFALAGYLTLPMNANPPLGVEVNVMGMLNTLEAARLLAGKKIVFASSISVYGDRRSETITEETPFGSYGVNAAISTYASTKLVGEHLGRLYAQKYGVAACNARFSTVYGENQHGRGVNALYILEALQAVARGQPPVIAGTGEESHDFIHASDVARGCIAMMARGGPGATFNIASGVSTSVNKLVGMVLDEYNSTLKPAYKEDTRDAKAPSHSKLDISIERARTQLAWEPRVSLAAGIHGLRVWMESQ